MRIGEYAFSGTFDSKSLILFQGSKAQWDDAIGSNELGYVSITYNYFSVDADFKLSGTSFNYTGKAIKPAVTVTYDGKQLIEGTDYELVYKNNTNAGTASVDINGIGNYSGTATKTFTIKKAANQITAKNIVRNYSTKNQTFAIGVKISNGTPKYVSDNKSVSVSKTGTVTVKAGFIGKATITVTAPEYINFSKTTKKILIVVNPPKTGIASLSSPASGKMTVKWKKNAIGTGYQIQYSTSNKFTNAKSFTVTKNTIVSKTFTGLAKGKKYYVRMRTYKTVGGVKFYSDWCIVKTVTIRK